MVKYAGLRHFCVERVSLVVDDDWLQAASDKFATPAERRANIAVKCSALVSAGVSASLMALSYSLYKKSAILSFGDGMLLST
jgi:hypothetical protein